VKKLAAVLLLIALVAAAFGGWVWHTLTAPVTLPAGGALVSFDPDMSFRALCARLEAAGVVRHAWVLRLWARWTGVDRQVRSGEYRFIGALSPLEVLANLRSSAAALHRVTIPEGSTVDDVARLLAAAGFGSAEDYHCLARDPHLLARLEMPASGLEGYLFPDTYAFAWSTASADILATMVERFQDQVAPLQAARLAVGLSEEDMVTLASIIEKETGAEHERNLVAAVFHNRLRIGMPLQSDPTAVYGRAERRAPTAADLDIDSPYNTYRIRGLPRGPICNPGRAALEAAVSPAREPYLYFVSRNDGTHVFSSTLEEHNRAVATFQRRRP
jgi:UPF0755 protein